MSRVQWKSVSDEMHLMSGDVLVAVVAYDVLARRDDPKKYRWRFLLEKHAAGNEVKQHDAMTRARQVFDGWCTRAGLEQRET